MVTRRSTRLVVKERRDWWARVRGPDGRQPWVRPLIFVVPGPAPHNSSRREGDICLVAAVNLTS
jgi:hypothetical protein